MSAANSRSPRGVRCYETDSHPAVLAKVNDTENSPSRIRVYPETVNDFGVMNCDLETRNTCRPKFCLDHLCTEVVTEEQMKEIFNYFDADRNGYIDLAEFKAVFKESFEQYGAPMTDKDVERTFEKLDKGTGKGVKGDGKLYFDEFCVLLLSRMKL